jgi:hypothetical protein
MTDRSEIERIIARHDAGEPLSRRIAAGELVTVAVIKQVKEKGQ